MRTDGHARLFAVTGIALAAMLGLFGLVLAAAAGMAASALAAWAALAVALLAAVASLRADRSARWRTDALSAEIGVVSKRLLLLEGRPAALPAPGEAVGEATEIAGLSQDLGILGGTIAGLAEALATQERELDTLRLRLDTELSPPAGRRTRPAEPGDGPDRLDIPSLVSSLLARAEREPPGGSAAPPPPPTSPRPVEPPAAKTPAPPPATASSDALDALDGGGLEVHLQPVVSLPQRRPRFYMAHPRLRDAEGALLDAVDARAALVRQNRGAQLDGQALSKVVSLAAALLGRGSDALLACPISAAAIEQPSFLTAVEAILAAEPQAARCIVLDVPARVFADPSLFAALGRLVARGATLAAEGLPRLDPAAMAAAGLRFVRLDAAGLVADDAGADRRATALVARLAAHGVQVVAGDADSEDIIRELVDMDVPLAQGLILGAPRPFRPPADRPTSSASTPDGSGPDAPRPLKSILRRAG